MLARVASLKGCCPDPEDPLLIPPLMPRVPLTGRYIAAAPGEVLGILVDLGLLVRGVAGLERVRVST